MRVASIHVHPVKATAPVTVPSVTVQLAGLRDDRRWAVVDGTGRPIGATTHDRLLTVTATPDASGALTLTHPSVPALVVPVPVDGRSIPVGVSRLPTMVDAGDAAAAWFSRVLGESVRLAWQDDPARRPISPEHGGLGAEPLSLADTAPLLLTTTASLARLDAWIAEDHGPEPMAMGRFRPNVVVEGGDVPFAEDAWRTVRIGDVEHRFAELCDRCVVTTIDPVTLARGKEPIRTLARHRRWDGRTWFGVRLVPLTTGTIAVGDPVTAA
jgi:uncharacterized protein YcbX